MSETHGGEQNPEDEFIEQLGLVDAEEIERAREVLGNYRQAIGEVLETDVVLLTPSARFVEDLGGDSLSVLEVLEIMQDKHDVDLPTEAFDGVGTVAQGFKVIIAIINKRTGEGWGDGPESGDREPRNPVPSAPSGSAHKDLPR